MLKIDMHVHTWYSDSRASVEEVLEAARQKGLDGVAITDHDTLYGAYRAAEKKGKLIVIPGEEVMTNQGEILSLGIKKTIPKDLSVVEAIERTHLQRGLVIVPHPTIPLFGRFRERDLKNLQIDGLEVLSAVTPIPGYFLKKNLELARRLGVSITVGSDSHSSETVGDAYTIVNSESRDLRDILRAIRLGHTSVGGHASKSAFKIGMVKGLFIHVLKAYVAPSHRILRT